jgi:hypothetical protein
VLTSVLCRATIAAVALIDYAVSGSLCSCGTEPCAPLAIIHTTRIASGRSEGQGEISSLGGVLTDKSVAASGGGDSATAQSKKREYNVTCIRSSPHHGKPHNGALVMMVLGKVDLEVFSRPFGPGEFTSSMELNRVMVSWCEFVLRTRRSYKC